MIDANVFRNLFRRAILLPVFLVGIVALLLVGQITNLVLAGRLVDRADQIISQTREVQLLALDIETGERGYLIAGDKNFLEPYYHGMSKIGGIFNDLFAMVADEPIQKAQVIKAQADFEKFYANEREEIILHAVDKDYRQEFNREYSKIRMDALRKDFAAIISYEQILRTQREQHAREATEGTLLVTAAFAGGVAILLAAFSRSQLRTLAATYEEALNSAHNAQETFSTTLHSIGDAVLVTDAHGRVTMLNAVAEQLTGWSSTDAQGRESHTIFKIINEQSRQEIENPVTRVIATGKKVVVANYTLLVRRDGSEIPVDDSASPIFGADRQLRGTVLVFRDVSDRRDEEARLKETLRREHNIANQLQASLQPAVPSKVEGLDLAEYYKPALNEAGVGGDFCDVFSGGNGQTYLVVGDLSGKGLAAAAQVATVRNMLRFALYNGRTLAGPIKRLNNTIIENGLLFGFATLFVGSYHHDTGELTYVNCGQEPSLLRRCGSSEIVELESTGPVLGSIPGADFDEITLTLDPCDTLAIFTDGLPEAGPKRSEMLEIAGIASVMHEMADQCGAEHTVTSIITRMNEWSGGQNHDDVCLLVAVARPRPEDALQEQ